MAVRNSRLAGRYRAEFPVFEQQIYLNTCSLGALSRRNRDAVGRFLDEWDNRGAAAWYDVWLERLARLRHGYARIVGAPAKTIALHASVSTAAGVVGSCLDLARRPRIVTTSLDFPTVTYQWLAMRPAGAEVVVVESPDGVTVPLERLADAVDDQTALVATSHVYFTTGAVQDVAGVAGLARERGAMCFIDGYQGAGQVPVDVPATGTDFYAAGGLKWLLGGPGITFLYARADRIQALEPRVTGWFGTADQFAFDARMLQFHDDARRFEQGTPALAAVHTQLGGLELIEEIGLDAVQAETQRLARDLIDRATAAGRPPLEVPPERRSGIVGIPSPDPGAEVRRLAAAGVVADARPGLIRLSPYFYNTEDDNAAAIDALTA